MINLFAVLLDINKNKFLEILKDELLVCQIRK